MVQWNELPNISSVRFQFFPQNFFGFFTDLKVVMLQNYISLLSESFGIIELRIC